MQKQLLTITFSLVFNFMFAQTYICWKAEIVELNKSTNYYETKQKIDLNSEAYFSETRIRINDSKVFLKIISIQSKVRSAEGTVTIYDTVSDEGDKWAATVVTDINGILKLFITVPNSSIGFVYHIKNR